MSEKKQDYLELLLIRQKGRRRDTVLLGGIFWIFFVALVFLTLTEQLTGRALVIVTAIEVVFGMAYLMAWMRLEQIKNILEMLRNTMD